MLVTKNEVSVQLCQVFTSAGQSIKEMIESTMRLCGQYGKSLAKEAYE